MPANLENSAMATGLEQVSFHSNPKEYSNYCTTVLISHTSKVKLKSLQARLKQHVNQEPHGLQHARLPCLSLSLSLLKFMSIESAMPSNHLKLCCPCSSVHSLSLASESFSVSQLFTWTGQSTGALASASVFPVNIQGWFPFGLTGLISMLSKGLSPGPQFESINFSVLSLLYGPSVHDYWKNHSFDYMDLCWQINVFAF